MDPIVLDLPNPGGDRGQWGYKSNAAMQQMADSLNALPTEIDTVVDNEINSRGLVQPIDRVTALKASGRKLVVAHRAGARIYPEYSVEGYEDSFRSGFILEADIRRLASGELVMCHDATTARTMTGASANVSALNLDQWLSRQCLPPWRGGAYGQVLTWEDLLDAYGGRCVLAPEVKDATVLNSLIDSITRRGLHRSVILQSFTLAHVQAAAAAGVAALYLTGATTTVTPQQLIDSDIEFIGPSTGMTATDRDTFRSAGLKVVPYTVGSRGEWVGLQGSVDGAFFDDPWGATQRYAQSERDPFDTGVPPKGWEYWSPDGVTSATDLLANYQDDGLTILGLQGATTKAIRQGWARPQTLTPGGIIRLRFRIKFGSSRETATSTRWGGVFLGVTPNDQAYQDGASGAVGQTGYHFLMRRNGSMEVWKVLSGAGAANLQSLDTGDFAKPDSGSEVPMEILLGETGVVIRRLDQEGNNSITVVDSAFRTNMSLHFSANATNATFKDVSYTTIPDAAAIGY